MTRIAIAIGDPNGIGPEIVLKAIDDSDVERRKPGRLAVFGSHEVLQRTAEQLGLGHLLSGLDVRDVGSLPNDEWSPGRVSAAAGASTVESASAAIAAVRQGEFDAVLAAPHHETAIRLAGIPFSGYPSLVERACALPADSVFVMLVGGGLRIVHATLHERLSGALARLTPEIVVTAAEAGAQACMRLGITRPRIGVFGVNPHASENGLFGVDDERITVPASHRLRERGWAADDPRGGDVLLADRAHDLYVAMYHDQGHIPVKLLAPKAAAALSVGAGVVLASVAHGSAMDIAGKGTASADALVRTWRLLTDGALEPVSP